MKSTYAWTTPKGASIEMTITVEHITHKTIDADGFEVEVNCDEWMREINSCKVNGKETALKELAIINNTDCVVIARRGADRVAAALPSDIAEAIFGEERKDRAEKKAATKKMMDEYDAHREMMKKVMGY